MKKLLIVFLALCLFVFPAMAQTQDDPQVITWDELEESFLETGYNYDFWNIYDLGFKIMIPAGLEPVELSQENIDDGFAAIFATEDQNIMVLISYRDLGCETLEEVAQLVLENIEDAKFGGFFKINGFDAIMFLNPGNDDLTVAIGTTEPKHFIQVSIKPISNEEINKLSGFIFGSIQPLDEE